MDKKKHITPEIPNPDYPEVRPEEEPILPLIPEEDPDIIPEEDPFENPPPYEVPPPAEGP
jgi:hypothetical protein